MSTTCFCFFQTKTSEDIYSTVGQVQSNCNLRLQNDLTEESYLVHVKGPEHLLDVGVGLGVQASQAKELLELMQGELTRRTLSHELLVPEVHLHRLKVVHGASRCVSHFAPSKHLSRVTEQMGVTAAAPLSPLGLL